MPSEREVMDDETRRRIAAEKKRVAIAARDARLAAKGKTPGEGIAAAHGILTGAEGEEFERAFWAARMAGMGNDKAPVLD
jgi:hypothetical protein